MDRFPTVRAVCPAVDPWVSPCFDLFSQGQCPNPGVEIVLLLRIFAALGLSVEFIKVNSTTDLIDSLASNSADMACTALELQQERLRDLTSDSQYNGN